VGERCIFRLLATKPNTKVNRPSSGSGRRHLKQAAGHDPEPTEPG
jgi:hypothetical protein